jgi:hypothetical protein
MQETSAAKLYVNSLYPYAREPQVVVTFVSLPWQEASCINWDAVDSNLGVLHREPSAVHLHHKSINYNWRNEERFIFQVWI